MGTNEKQLDFYMFSYDQGLRASVTYDRRFEDPSERVAHPHGRRVILYSQSLTSEHLYETLLPLEPELARWRGLEKSLLAALDVGGVRHVKAGHMIYGGLYDILFQTADPGAFDAIYQRWTCEGERGRIESRESQGWSYFEDKIQPRDARRLWSTNAKMIEALRGAGLDVSRPQAIEHHFLGDMAALREAAAFLPLAIPGQTVQVAVTPSSPDGAETGQLTATVSVVLDPEIVSAQEWQFRTIATELGLDYDGWGAHVGSGEAPARARAAPAQDGRERIRAQAAAIVERLELAGYDNASVNKADAWLDSEACKQALNAPPEAQKELVDSVGAYLGEAVIRRHGGSWNLAGERPMVVLKRNGAHIVDPIGKVLKRLRNGKQDDLLSLVNLVGYVAGGPANHPIAPSPALHASMGPQPRSEAEIKRRSGNFLLILVFVMVVLPIVLTAIITLVFKAC
jgi:regulator of RNase E activity RraB